MHRLDSRADDRDDATWLVDVGHAVLEKKRSHGLLALTPAERLLQCFWIADYSMRRAGDLTAARELDPTILPDARTAATALGLPVAATMFGLSEGEFERRFFELFDAVCTELRRR